MMFLNISVFYYLSEANVLMIQSVKQLHSNKRNKQAVCCFVGASKIVPVILSIYFQPFMYTAVVLLSCIINITLFFV
jgi:hypothetical protein